MKPFRIKYDEVEFGGLHFMHYCIEKRILFFFWKRTGDHYATLTDAEYRMKQYESGRFVV